MRQTKMWLEDEVRYAKAISFLWGFCTGLGTMFGACVLLGFYLP